MLVRAYYAMQDGKTPFVVNSVVIGLNIAINVPMFAWLGVKGLAAGHALAYTLGVVLLTKDLGGKIGDLRVARVVAAAWRISLATAAMSAVVFAARTGVEALDPPGAAAITLVVATVAGGASYLVFAALLKVEEMSFVKGVIARRAKGGS